jgi:hypothetical protein
MDLQKQNIFNIRSKFINRHQANISNEKKCGLFENKARALSYEGRNGMLEDLLLHIEKDEKDESS